MKNAADPRHLARIQRMHALFSMGFSGKLPEDADAETLEIQKRLSEIDAKIAAAATERPLHQLAPLDLAILRISVYELLRHDTPPKVVIDEAIEIAKEFGSETSPKFVNGVLATIASQKVTLT